MSPNHRLNETVAPDGQTGAALKHNRPPFSQYSLKTAAGQASRAPTYGTAAWRHLSSAYRPTAGAPGPVSIGEACQRSRLLTRFPVATVLAVQYGAMVLFPALVKETQPLSLIVFICTTALITAFVIEALLSPLGDRRPRPSNAGLRSARSVLLIGWLALVGTGLTGAGSYAVQIGTATRSPIASLLTPFSAWPVFGLALYFWLYRQLKVERREVLVMSLVTCSLYVALGLYRAILGQAFAAIAAILFTAAVYKLVTLRVLVGILLVVSLAWAPVYQFRDELRARVSGPGAVVSAGDPLQRLQLDEQMSILGSLLPRPPGLDSPTAQTLIRTGLLPSVVDPDRPPIDTGSRISVALGGRANNAQSATMLGNVYLFGSAPALVLVTISLALAMAFAVRSASPWALMFAALVYLYALSFNATYPDFIPKILQALVSMSVAYGLVHVIETPHRRRSLALPARVTPVARVLW